MYKFWTDNHATLLYVKNWKNYKLLFFQNFLNRKINAIFGIFNKKKRRFMCQTWLQDKVNDVIDDIIALSDVEDKCVLVSFV